MSFLKWEEDKKDINVQYQEDKKTNKIGKNEFWKYLEKYVTTNNEKEAEELLSLLTKSNYPPVTTLINSLSFDYRNRVYLNNLINDSSQYWLYNRRNVFMLLRYLYKIGFFIWFPKKDYVFISNKIKKMFPWLNSQELSIIQELIKNTENIMANKEKSLHDTLADKSKIKYDTLIELTTKNDECKQCPQYKQTQVFGDIKYKDKQVDILFVGEAPHTKEVEVGKPFVGSSRYIRDVIETMPSDINWVIWNSMLCQVLPKKKDMNKALQCCKRNLLLAIDILQPKVIVLLGGTAYEALFNESRVSDAIGKIFNFKDSKVLVTYHPAAALHNPKMKDTVLSTIDNAVAQAVNIVCSGKSINVDIATKKPDWFSEYIQKEYKLLDVQDFDDGILYVFKDKEEKRHVEFKKFTELKGFYYCYKCDDTKLPIVDMNKCKLVLIKNTDQLKSVKYNKTMYHGDIPISTRHAIDYFLEAERYNIDQHVTLKIGMLDIEVLPEDRISFPKAENDNDVINAISFALYENSEDCDIHTWFLNLNDIEINNDKVKCFKTEKELLEDFIDTIIKLDPDILAGWNVFFDLEYIITRCKKLNIDVNKLSPVKKIIVDHQKKYVFIGGRIIIDMLKTYKQLTFEQKTSYALQYIANEELGYGKVQYDCPFGELYDRNPQKFLEYNRQDVKLLIDLEKKLMHISFLDQLRRLIKGTWLSLVSTSSQCDTMLVSYLEHRGLVSRNRVESSSTDVFKGAFVFQPKPGIRKWVFDLDYSSLYPNIIRSFNIGIDTFYAFIPNENLIEKILFCNKIPNKIPIIFDPLYNDKQTYISKNEFKELRKKCLITPNGCCFLRQSIKRGVMYDLLTILLDTRAKYKKMYKNVTDIAEKQRYYIMQWAYKILANSFYGYLGFQYSRLHDRRVAAAVTSVGRIVIKTGISVADICVEQIRDKTYNRDISSIVIKENIEFNNVVYGDTDSIFVTLDNVLDIIDPIKFLTGNDLKELENKIDNRTRQYLNDIFMLEESYFSLKNEWIASKFLQTSKKKRYAYITYPDEKIKVVGIEVKRSDQPPIIRQYLKELLDFILKTDNLTHDNIMNVIEDYAVKYKNMVKNRLTECGKPMTTNFKKPNLPQCRAAKLWNDIEYKYFKDGVKGFYFYLAGIDLSKINKKVNVNIKDILVPPEVKHVPDYYVIDIEKMVNDLWFKKVEAIVSEIMPSVFAKSKKILSNIVNLATW